MKIAFCNRKKWNNPLGGDGIQMLKTKEAIERLNNDIEIDIVTDTSNLSNYYDIVHIFNYACTNETEAFIKAAKRSNIPIASSSIFWEYKYAATPPLQRIGLIPNSISNRYIRFNIMLNKILARTIGKPSLMTDKFRRKVMNFMLESDVILPNSKEEGDLLLQFIDNTKIKEDCRKKINIVYNGVDVDNVHIIPRDDFFKKYNIPQNYILQVSRIQYIKNQLNLISALKNDIDIPIVFVGQDIEKHYCGKVQKLAKKRGNVYFIPHIPHEDVYSFYFYARTHVLLSFRESPGLVSLEALSQGCPIVVADKRFTPVDTYFTAEGVQIVDPLDLNDIRNGILKSYNSKISNISLHDFTWNNIAIQTLKAYKTIKL